MREVHVEVYPRVHLGLISMHEDAPRANGGIGFAVEGPAASIFARRAERFSLRDDRSIPMAADELIELASVAKAFAELQGVSQDIALQIDGNMRTHVGMGSATAIRLGVVECIALLNGLQLSADALVAASRRGGTSGVGINTYFKGRLVCDLGKRYVSNAYVPSSRATPINIPLTLPTLDMGSWPMLFAVPRTIVPKTQAEESSFFERTTPLPKAASFEACYIALFQIYAAAVEQDYAAFCHGVNEIQNTSWKKAERDEYGNFLRNLNDKLESAGADCVGMSSLGPMLFCFARRERLPSLSKIAEEFDCDTYQTMPRNDGRTVKISYA